MTVQYGQLHHPRSPEQSQTHSSEEEDPPAQHSPMEEDIPSQNLPPTQYSQIESIANAQQYINMIQGATLDNNILPDGVLDRLREPVEGVVDIWNPFVRLAIDIFIATTDASDRTYNALCIAIQQCWPEAELLSYYQVKKLVAEISGVVIVKEDMCIDSCMAFTGPHANLDACLHCAKPRWDPLQLEKGKQIPQQQFPMFPLGPQLQPMWRSKENAKAMRYRHEKGQAILEDNSADMAYDDIISGSEYWELYQKANPNPTDVLVSLSIDGAQLYRNKKSDTWIACYKIENLPPKKRFKDLSSMTAVVIPGPNKPKDVESFMFRALYHVSALQHEQNGAGMKIWDAQTEAVQDSRVLFGFMLADALGLAEVDGRVGHHGAQACRLSCPMKGRHKPNSGHYYTAHLKPLNNPVRDCDHDDFDFENYPDPSMLDIGFDASHKAEYWRAYFVFVARSTACCHYRQHPVLDEVWVEHGQIITNATSYFPSFFQRPPRNPAEKISSGYKATEYFLYLFGLGPGVFRSIIPKEYYQNFCRLVSGVRILLQISIRESEAEVAKEHLISFIKEYEQLYYQHRVDRLHFCRPWLHTILHAPSEVYRVGPGLYSIQFFMERHIWILSKRLRQLSNTYGNLIAGALRHCECIAVAAMCPELYAGDKKGPRGSVDIGDQFLFLRPRERSHLWIESDSPMERSFVQQYLSTTDPVKWWGRLKLPNGQVSRSLWQESQSSWKNIRISRNVKFRLNDIIEYGEVQFYFMRTQEGGNPVDLDDIDQTGRFYALVSVYSRPDAGLLEESYNTLWACQYQGSQNLAVILVKSILSVVSVQPLPKQPDRDDGLWFVLEKCGVEEIELMGVGYNRDSDFPDKL
ncbi:hypothetical protein D9758_006949 [Tetrapyrgos nigripes]|uniref:Uncharacterized protein n=1 Tax=Tetrapyrgos nigripes TaxID=182062 RepID=A0A8H5LUV7_9AGAR|nr:hypothetical protein D9758_006949 [Tetrapyrgos nigripes]